MQDIRFAGIPFRVEVDGDQRRLTSPALVLSVARRIMAALRRQGTYAELDVEGNGAYVRIY